MVEIEARPRIELKHHTLVLYVRPDTPTDKRQRIIDAWYRAQLKQVVPTLIGKWETKLDVQVAEFGIRR